MGWFSKLVNPLSAIPGDVGQSANILKPVLRGATDQIGRDWSQLRQGQLPTGPTLKQAGDQIGRDVGASWQGLRQGADAAARDTRYGIANAPAAMQGLRQTGAMPGTLPGGMMAPGSPFGQGRPMPQGMQPGAMPPQGAKGRPPMPGQGMPQGMPQTPMGAPGAQGMPQGMQPGQFVPQGGQGAPGGGMPPGFAKGGGQMNPQQQALMQAAILRNARPAMSGQTAQAM